MNQDKSNLNEQLFYAVKESNNSEVKKLLKNGANPNAYKINSGITVLGQAIFMGRSSTLKILLDNGADINIKEQDGYNAILHASNYGHLTIVKTLQIAGADIHSLAKNKTNCLMLFAGSGNLNINELNYFLEQGIDINAQNKEGKTALMFFVERFNTNEYETYKEFIKNGADIKLKDKRGNNILYYAVIGDCPSLVKYLLDSGVKFSETGENLLQAIDNELIMDNRDEIKEILEQYQYTSSSKTISYKINVVCKQCGNVVPMNGPFATIKCPNCLTETEVPDDIYNEEAINHYLEMSKYNLIRISETVEEVQVESKQELPLCSKCGEELDISNYNYGTQEPLICPECGEENISYPVPEFLKQQMYYGLTPIQVFCADKDNSDNIEQKEIKPQIFKCTSCSASLHVTKDNPKKITCESCGTTQEIPTSVWKELHPEIKGKTWYVYYGEDKNKKKLSGEDLLLIDALKKFKDKEIKELLEKGADPNTVIDNDNKTVLMYAAHTANAAAIKILLKYGADLKLRDNILDYNAILFACSAGCKECIELLKEAGADIHSLSKEGSNALMAATYNDNHQIIKYLIEQEIDVNAKDKYGHTALRYCIRNCFDVDDIYLGEENMKIRKNKIKTIEKLLENGADINMTDEYGHSVLFKAVLSGCYYFSELLLKNGARTDLPIDDLLKIVEGIDDNKDEIKSLLKKHGAQSVPFTIAYELGIVCKECGNHIPLNGPFEKATCPYCKTETKISEIFDDMWENIFLNSCYDSNSYSYKESYNIELKRKPPQCSECGTDLDISNYNFGSTDPLICPKCAHKMNSYPAPKFFQKYNVQELKPIQIFGAEEEIEVDEQNDFIKEVKPIAVKCVSCGASMKISTKTPRLCTCEYCESQQYLPDTIWEELHPVKKKKQWYVYFENLNKEQTQSNQQLLKAVEEFKAAKAKKLLKKGANPNSVNTEGKTLLMMAAHRNDKAMVKVLLEFGADINKVDKDEGFNAILYAAINGDLKIFKILQSAGADIHSKSFNNTNCLMTAASNHNYEIVEYLINQGIDVNAQNDKAYTALMYSLNKCEKFYDLDLYGEDKKEYETQKKILELLIEKGADINHVAKDGYNPLSSAIFKGGLVFTEFLLKAGARTDFSKYSLLQMAEEQCEQYSDDMKELLIKYGVKNKPFVDSFEISFVCEKCGEHVPVNSPLEKVKCPDCGKEINLLEEKERWNGDNLWYEIFDFSDMGISEPFTYEKVYNVNVQREKPICSKCDAELDISNYNFGTEEPLVCKECGHENKSFPAPDFLKKYTYNELSPKQIFCTEKKDIDENTNQEDIKPIAFQCSSCNGTLHITKETKRNHSCEFCGTTLYLPDPIWFALHPKKTRKKWYIYFE